MIPLNRQTQLPPASPNTLDLMVKRGTDIGGGVITWSNFDEKTPVSALPEPCKQELKKTFQKVGCNTYNPDTAEKVFGLIQQGKSLKEIIHALHKHKGCKEATIKRVHAAIKKGYTHKAPPLPKKEGRVRLYFGING